MSIKYILGLFLGMAMVAGITVDAHAAILGTIQVPITAGAPASTVTAGDCENGNSWCITVQSTGAAARTQVIATNQTLCFDPNIITSNINARALEPIGAHGGMGMMVATSFCVHGGDTSGSAPIRAVLAIVNLRTMHVISLTESPDKKTVQGYYIDFPKGPDGDEYPFLAPGGNGSVTETPQNPIWNYMALFRDRAQGGPGFQQISLNPTGSYLDPSRTDFVREVGGYLEDLDGDGWQDISLIYHSLIYTVSGKTARPLATTVYDISSTAKYMSYMSPNPNSPEWFHYGRNYGIVSALSGSDGVTREVFIGGGMVGTFNDADCNVTHFVGMLQSTPSNPAGRSLLWSRYYGFTSNNFAGPFNGPDPNPIVLRPGDGVNGCVHRFGDALTTIGATPAVIYNYFTASDTTHYEQLNGSPEPNPAIPCDLEQFTYYLPGGDQSANGPSAKCYSSLLKARGVWSMQVLRLSDGSALTGSTQAYIWGMSQKLIPSGEMAYVTQITSAQSNFDLSDQAEPQLSIRGLNAQGYWEDFGELPVRGLPIIQQFTPRGSQGAGSASSFTGLVTVDIDHDGLDDFAICSTATPQTIYTVVCPAADVQWVGYDRNTGKFVVKGQ